MPILPHQPTSERGFSLKSFLADQTINIIASLEAFLILLGSLSFIITTSNLLLSFIVMLIVHSLFGISGAISPQFSCCCSYIHRYLCSASASGRFCSVSIGRSIGRKTPHRAYSAKSGSYCCSLCSYCLWLASYLP